jgi:YD repeat-containing protein
MQQAPNTPSQVPRRAPSKRAARSGLAFRPAARGSRRRAGFLTTSFTYDARGRISTVKQGTTTLATYGYDYAQHRVSSRDRGITVMVWTALC